ncbi:hypothetical protein [Mesorhizobium sp. CAU 1741]|uniref:hypothetical protein n=1 Tax=Mesorhizobium sp. CAU 1741 TaxID=3140366 RepID=UPI00325A5F10
MRSLAIVLLCAMAAGCSQTSGTSSPEMAASSKSGGQSRHSEGKKSDPCDKAIQAQANSAMLGSALGMVGSFGGFGGRGGAVAAQVASTAGGMVARSQAQKAQETVMRECYKRGGY